jgi:formamidopyrimidine-DNA glycosylase
MPELAEVEFNRRIWDPGLGQRVLEVRLNAKARVFRNADTAELASALTDATLKGSAARGKQMAFRFGVSGWVGIHLGMTGALRVEPSGFEPGKHDHLALRQRGRWLVFTDPRQFGLVRFSPGAETPAWWSALPPEVLDRAWTLEGLREFLRRRKGSPIKPLLLDQEQFHGVGNWMADEILWRAEIHPRRLAKSLSKEEIKRLYEQTRFVCRGALKSIGQRGGDPPRGWLFHARWQDGGLCPKTGVPLIREEIAGRTACWSPGRQSGAR